MSVTKAPESKLPYGFDYTAWLDPGEEVVNATWSAAPTNPENDMTISTDPAPAINGNVVTCWLEGGTQGVGYTFLVLVTTSSGKVDERALQVICTVW